MSCLHAPVLERLRRLLKVERLKGGARAALNTTAAALDHLGAQRLRESARRHAEVALEVADDRVWQREGLCLLEDGLWGEALRDHKLREIADDLGGRRDLGDVSEELVRLCIHQLDLGPLLGEAELARLVE